MLTPERLHDALTELGRFARREGRVIDLAVYGGSALMLASNFRASTEDVDAVAFNDRDSAARLAAEVARKLGLAEDWLNDGVRTYLSPNVEDTAEHHTLFRTYPSESEPGLRVYVPSPEYLLAMKLMAMRLDPSAGKSDLADLVALMDLAGLSTVEDVIDFASRFYPEAKFSARLHLGIRTVLRELNRSRSDTGRDPPSYLSGGRPTP